ncbi:MAG: c-type cytochrome [Xanthobacteraceae bacterium]
MRIVFVAVIMIAAATGTAAAQDATAGEHVFNTCRPCHAIGPDAVNMLGPELNGLDGRPSGSVPGYPYTDANKKSGIVWNEKTFKQYIKDPQAMVPGTKMFFAGIKDQQKVTDLWAYVSQFNADGSIKKK